MHKHLLRLDFSMNHSGQLWLLTATSTVNHTGFVAWYRKLTLLVIVSSTLAILRLWQSMSNLSEESFHLIYESTRELDL